MQFGRGSDKQVGKMVLRGTALMVGGRFGRMAIGLVGTAILARLLTPADFGVFAVASMVLALGIALLDGIIDVPVIREDNLTNEVVANLIWTSVAAMAVLAILVWFSAPWLAQLLNSPQLSVVLPVVAASVMLQPFVSASYAVLRRHHRFAVVSAFYLTSGAIYAVVAIAMAWLGYGIWSLVWGQIASLAASAVIACAWARVPLLPPKQFRPLDAWGMGGLGFSARLLAWVSTNIDTLFASAQLGAVGAGIYSRAYNITTQLKEPFSTIDLVVRQAFVAQKSLEDSAAARAALNGLRVVVLAAAFASASVIALREPVVAILLGHQWDAVTLPLAVLAASLPARVARLYLDGLTYARGSLLRLTGRNALIVVLLVSGLSIWAHQGVVAIALVVAVSHVVLLLIPIGASEQAVAGTLLQRLIAILPGYALGLILVAISESLAVIATPSGGFAEWAVRAGVCGLVVTAAAVLIPDNWLPSSVRDQRAKVLRFRAKRP
jgi:O-antigen/teichoic acid export membrane protein